MVAAGVGLLVAAAVVVAVVVADGGSSGMTVDDGIGDCREPGRDIGFRCDEGAEVRSVQVSRDGATIVVEVELDTAPSLAPDREWRLQFNVASANGKVCGLSNVTEEGEPTSDAISYGYDPAFGLSELTRRALPDGVCAGVLVDATATITVDMSDQPAEEPFRVVGFTQLEYPADDDQPGSEDDFGFDVVMSDL